MNGTCVRAPFSVVEESGKLPPSRRMRACPSTTDLHVVGERDMTEVRRQRILIGVLDTMTALLSAIDDLSSSNLDQDDMLIVADAGALFGLLERRFSRAGVSGSGPCVVVRKSISGRSADSILRYGYFVPETSSFQTPQIEKWIESGLSMAQDRHLQAGGALLVVRVRTAEEERLYSETMLLHSVDNVQLHDI